MASLPPLAPLPQGEASSSDPYVTGSDPLSTGPDSLSPRRSPLISNRLVVDKNINESSMAADDEQSQATATAASNGGNGNGGVGRVGGKEIDGGEPHGKNKEINHGKKVKESSLGHNIIKEKYQKVDKANEIDGGELHHVKNKEIHRGKKLNESPLGRTIIKKVDKVNEKQIQVSQKPISEKSKNNKSASPRPPIQVTRSPGVNFLVRAASVKKEAVKRANMGGSPSTPQPPSQNQFGSPSLQDVSPDTRATISQASKRKRRKLISDIWAEAEPIYKDGKLVEGKCIHCHQIFAAGREIDIWAEAEPIYKK